MSNIIQPMQQPMVYPTWEVWMGVVSTGVLINTLAPLIGNMPIDPHGVPVIRNFATTRFAARMTQMVAGPPAAWDALLFKNGALAATAFAINWGVAPAVVQTTKGWTATAGGVATRVEFKRGDYWSIQLSGVASASLVTAPSVICMMDMYGNFQTTGGMGA